MKTWYDIRHFTISAHSELREKGARRLALKATQPEAPSKVPKIILSVSQLITRQLTPIATAYALTVKLQDSVRWTRRFSTSFLFYH